MRVLMAIAMFLVASMAFAEEAVAPKSGIMAFFDSVGGIVPFVLACLVLINGVLSSIVVFLNKINVAVGATGWISKVCAILVKIIDFLTGNLQHK